MKPVFTLCCFFLLLQSIKAQSGAKTIRADISGIFYITQFQQDSLVPPKRRGRRGVVTELMANSYYEFTLKNLRWKYKAGIGYSQKEMVLNKYSLGDILFAFFPFSSFQPDTFRIQSIRYKYDYLNVPLGFAYRLTRKSTNWFQAQVGLQANVGFCINKNVVLKFDPTVPPPSPSETDQLKGIYNTGASSVVVGLLPRLDLNARIYKSVGIFYGVQFYTLQLNSFHQRVARVGTGFGGGIGAYVNL